ncbi:MAG: hypothetical protein U1F43_34375 [Myxococcota bacterium]
MTALSPPTRAASDPAARLPPWRPARPRPVLLVLAAALALGAGLGLVAGYGLRGVWPWILVEAVLGVALGVGLGLLQPGPRLDRRLLALAVLATIVGILVGHWRAMARSAPTPLGLGDYLALRLRTEPLLGELRPGALVNALVLALQALVIGWCAATAASAVAAYRGRGTPRRVRAFVAERVAAREPEAAIRQALSAAGWSDPAAQTDALVDGARLATSLAKAGDAAQTSRPPC